MSTTLLEPTVAPNIEAAPPNRDLSRLVARLTIAAVTAGILWRLVRYVMQFPIWGDEAYVALNFLDRDFWQMTHKLDYNQVAPVVFLWIEWLACRWLGPSELSLHLFPLLAGVAGLLLFWRFCRFTLPPAAGSLAVEHPGRVVLSGAACHGDQALFVRSAHGHALAGAGGPLAAAVCLGGAARRRQTRAASAGWCC